MTLRKARIEVVRETHFGTIVEDPYRWMEDRTAAESQAWLAEQAAHARSALDALPGRDTLLDRIGELGDTLPDLFNFQLAGGRTFYLRREPGAEVDKLVVRLTHAAPEQILVDPATIPGELPSAIDWYRPSRDGRRVAYGVSAGGSENSTLGVVEVDSGVQLADQISRVHFAHLSWLEDHHSFIYHRYPDLPAATPPTERRHNSQSYLHHLGADPEQDQVVLARGLNERVALTPVDRPFIIVPANSSWMLGIISHSALMDNMWTDCTFYVAPRAALANPATCPWIKLAAVEDGVTNFAFDADTLYLVTRRSAPRYEVLALALDNPDLAQAQVVVPASAAVIEDICIAGGDLLTRDLTAGIGQIRRIPRAGGQLAPVALPINGTILEWANEPGSPHVLLHMTAWTSSPRIYRYNSELEMLEDTGWAPPSAVDFSAMVAYEAHAAASDGTLIPLSIIHRQGLQRDGTNPTLLLVYGSYGLSIPTFFMPEMLPWYERGGVFAIAHVRGGGEYGREWHEAGRKLNKEQTITDFIACAEYLIAQGYTNPRRLAGQGGSAGGIPTGGALVRRPDLWAAMIMQVAVTNALRLELGENGPINVPEFGSFTTEEGFQSLQIIDSYLKIQDGVAYPAVVLTSGLQDRRIEVWQAMKMVARLQAATTSGKPVLLRLDEQGGHGIRTTRHQFNAELADLLALLFDQMGVKLA